MVYPPKAFQSSLFFFFFFPPSRPSSFNVEADQKKKISSTSFTFLFFFFFFFPLASFHLLLLLPPSSFLFFFFPPPNDATQKEEYHNNKRKSGSSCSLSLSICKGGNDPASFGTFFPVRQRMREREIFVWVVGMLKANGTDCKNQREIYRSYRRVIMIIKSKYRRPYIWIQREEEPASIGSIKTFHWNDRVRLSDCGECLSWSAFCIW